MCNCHQAPPWWPQSPLPQQSTFSRWFRIICRTPLSTHAKNQNMQPESFWVAVIGLLSTRLWAHVPKTQTCLQKDTDWYGASLSFHGASQPIFTLLDLYGKFGFKFDHIYGFEISFTDPKQVYGTLLPEKYFPTYHWINVGESIESNQVNSIAERQLLVESSTLKLLLHAMVVSIWFHNPCTLNMMILIHILFLALSLQHNRRKSYRGTQVEPTPLHLVNLWRRWLHCY